MHANTLKNFSVKTHETVFRMSAVSLMTALLCILCPLSFAAGAVPFTLAVFVLYLAAYVLGPVYGTLSCLLYLLLGAFGLPVFSGYTGGPARLLGPTGGYLFGYLFLVAVAGFFIEKAASLKKRGARLLLQLIGMTAGLLLCYLFGTVWFVFYNNSGLLSGGGAGGITFFEALSVCVFPFLLFDALKISAALFAGNALRAALRHAGRI